MTKKEPGWYVTRSDVDVADYNYSTYNREPFKDIVQAYNWAVELFGDYWEYEYTLENYFKLYEVKS